ncbi:MAG TPA: hypothetical protein VN615_07265 [Gaiellales bacterium]|nr:hypothetical protein [Gaiellales bacterium]
MAGPFARRAPAVLMASAERVTGPMSDLQSADSAASSRLTGTSGAGAPTSGSAEAVVVSAGPIP